MIAETLSLSGGERFPPLNLSPQCKKERTLPALLRRLPALTESGTELFERYQRSERALKVAT